MEFVRVALCQIDATVGDVVGNTTRILDALSVASENGAQIAVFPELALTGYPPEDLLHSPAFIAENLRARDVIAAQTTSCAAVIGFVDVAGHERFNAAAIMANGEVVGIWHKERLPNYGVFDERRWFSVGDARTPLFSIGGVRIGVAICEDAWFSDGPVVRQGVAGADVVVILNASPYRIGALGERSAMLANRAVEADATLVYVNLVGGQDELVFDGGSMVVDHTGAVIASLPQFTPSIATFDLSIAPKSVATDTHPVALMPSLHRGSAQLPLQVTAPLPVEVEVYEALVCATRDYVNKNGFSEIVLGLSGGVDSSIVATIAVDALGPSRVHGVALPSRYSSQSSLDDALELAKHLDIDFRVIEIESVHAANLELLAPHFEGRDQDLTEENLQARIRGTLMMALSNKFGWLVLTTANKSETAVGYSTMYGDSAGGFAVIKDVPKTLVYRLCAVRNERAGYDLIPSSVLTKAPSAELRPDQRDDDSLPPYEILDPILAAYVERNASIDDLIKGGAIPEVARRVVDMVDHAEYKRRQSPLGPRITSRGFGKDRRMPITNRFNASQVATGAVQTTDPDTGIAKQ